MSSATLREHQHTLINRTLMRLVSRPVSQACVQRLMRIRPTSASISSTKLRGDQRHGGIDLDIMREHLR